MASVSGKYTTGATSVDNGNAQAQPAPWSHAVSGDEDASGAPSNDYNANDYPSNLPPRQPLSSQVNGTSRSTTRPKNKYPQAFDPEYATSAGLRPPAQLNEHSDLSGTTSDADSLLDLYKPSRQQFKSALTARQPNVKRKGSLGAVSSLSEATPEDKESKWIHRDKLAQIESREMLAMGITTSRQPSRSRSRPGVKSSKSPSVDVDNEIQEDQEASQDAKRQRTVSPNFYGEEDEQQDSYQAFNYNQPAVPDEPVSRPVNEYHRRRPSVSKIPVTKSVPTAESTSPTQTSSPTQGDTRARSASQNATSPISPSGAMRGVPTQAASPASPQSSQKSKLPNKMTSQPGARGGKGGARSTSGQQRPGTANGSTSSRPNTSGGRAPEGDPPWMSSMFKPDPRLPPEEQMLPTHAKRLAQQQGMPDPIMYETARPEDSQYMLLDNEEPENSSYIDPPEQHPALIQQKAVPQQSGDAPKNFHYREPSEPSSFKGHQVASAESYEGEAFKYSPQDRQSNEWPLRSPRDQDTFHPEASPKNEEAPFAPRNGRSGTPVVDSGYSLMPTIPSTKELDPRLSQRSGLSNSNSVANAHSSERAIRVPEDPEPTEKETKKKGCAACCIVM